MGFKSAILGAEIGLRGGTTGGIAGRETGASRTGETEETHGANAHTVAADS